MNNSDKPTGNPVTNDTRSGYNKRVEKYKMLGSTKGKEWKGRMRNRSI
jgi:hypothetical protein